MPRPSARPFALDRRPLALLALLGAAGAFLATGAACGTSKGPVKLTEPVTRPGQWERTVAEHTRRNQAYTVQILEADLRATLVTPRLRSAFVLDRERFHGRTADDFADELLKLGKPPDEGYEAPMISQPTSESQVLMYVSLFVRESSYKELGTSYSAWDVELVRGKARVKPIEFERVRFSPNLQALLPHVDRFDQNYLIRFPIVDSETGTPMMSPGGDPIRLEIRSALGELKAEWKLVGDPSSFTVDTPPAEPLPDRAPPRGAPPAEAPTPAAQPEVPASDDETSSTDTTAAPQPDAGT